MSEHKARVEWNLKGPFEYKVYSRAHDISFEGGIHVPGNAAPANIPPTVPAAHGVDPEQAFVASLSSCHMLWFLHLARERQLRVVSYEDDAVGELNGVCMTRVELHPRVEFEDEPEGYVVADLHHAAHERCFLAASVNCPVEVMP